MTIDNGVTFPRHDEYGQYRATHRWIESWEGKSPGYAVRELREYVGGSYRVHMDEPVFLDSADPMVVAMFRMFLIGQTALFSVRD